MSTCEKKKVRYNAVATYVLESEAKLSEGQIDIIRWRMQDALDELQYHSRRYGDEFAVKVVSDSAEISEAPDQPKEIKKELLNAGNLTGDLSGIWGDAKHIKGNVTNIMKGDVSGIKGNVSGLRGDLSGLMGDLSGIYGNMTEIHGDVEELIRQGKLKRTVKPEPEKTEKKLLNAENLTGDVSGIWGDATGLSGVATVLRGDVTELEGDVSGIIGDPINIWGDISGLNGDVSGLEGDMTDIEGEVTGLEGDVEDLVRQGKLKSIGKPEPKPEPKLEPEKTNEARLVEVLDEIKARLDEIKTLFGK